MKNIDTKISEGGVIMPRCEEYSANPHNIEIVKIILVKDSSSPYRMQQIKKPESAVSVARDFLAGQDREVFIAINLDNSCKINSINIVSVGTVTQSIVHPREVFKSAILSNATSIILAHNHPSGTTKPSYEDIVMTKKLLECGDILGIKILDHIIVGDNGYTHFKDLDGKGFGWSAEIFNDT